jgi:hypothetical protein
MAETLETRKVERLAGSKVGLRVASRVVLLVEKKAVGMVDWKVEM